MSVHSKTVSTSISATTSSANAALPAGQSNAIRVLNVGSVVVFITTGPTAPTTTGTNQPMLPNTEKVFIISDEDQFVAAITASSTATVYVSRCTTVDNS